MFWDSDMIPFLVACALWYTPLILIARRKSLGEFSTWPLQICFWICVAGYIGYRMDGVFFGLLTFLPILIFMGEIWSEPASFISQISLAMFAVFSVLLIFSAWIGSTPLRLLAPTVASIVTLAALIPIGEQLSIRHMCTAAAELDSPLIYRRTFASSLSNVTQNYGDQHANLSPFAPPFFWSYSKGDFTNWNALEFDWHPKAPNFDCNRLNFFEM